MESLAADLATMARAPLAQAHVAPMRKAGRMIDLQAGQMRHDPGAPIEDFFYPLEGDLEAIDPRSMDRTGLATLGPGQFFGELNFLNGGVARMGRRAVARAGRSARGDAEADARQPRSERYRHHRPGCPPPPHPGTPRGRADAAGPRDQPRSPDRPARAVVVATGVQHRRMPLEGLERLEGAGVYYAATGCRRRTGG